MTYDKNRKPEEMKNQKKDSLLKRLSRARNSRVLRAFSTALAVMTVFGTTYGMILPAITVDHESAEEMPGIYLEEESFLDAGYEDGVQDADYENAYEEGIQGADYENAYEDDVQSVNYENVYEDDVQSVNYEDVYEDNVQGADYEDVYEESEWPSEEESSDEVYFDYDNADEDKYYVEIDENDSEVIADPDYDAPEYEDSSVELPAYTYLETRMETIVPVQTDLLGDVTIRLDYNSAAMIPDGSILSAFEITPYAETAEAAAYKEWRLENLTNWADALIADLDSDWYWKDASFFDVELTDPEGIIRQPGSQIYLTVYFTNPIYTEKVQFVRFIANEETDTETPEIMDPVDLGYTEDGGIYAGVFLADSLAPFGVITGDSLQAISEQQAEQAAEDTEIWEDEPETEEEIILFDETVEDDGFEVESETESMEEVALTESGTESAAEPVLTELETESVAEPVLTESETEPVAEPVLAESETESVAEPVLEEAVEYPARVFRGATENVNVTVLAPEGAFPADTTMTVQDVSGGVINDIAEAVSDDSTTVNKVHAVDITFTDGKGNEIEPLVPVKMTITAEEKQKTEETLVVHVSDEGNIEQVEDVITSDSRGSSRVRLTMEAGESGSVVQTDSGAEAVPESVLESVEETEDHEVVADAFSVYAIVYTVDFHYEVNGKMYEFSIPGGGFASFYKIVEVLGVVRIGENTADSGENQANEAESAPENVENTADSDVYNGVEKTGVDDNGANSNAYEESISLNNVEVSEATKKFVADVASVEFSSPELVWVGKANDTTTVGGLKETNGLEVQYNAELTEEQIDEINSSTVEGGDWALISVRPFTSEENLTVTMKNGDQFVVKVTDGQSITEYNSIVPGRDYILYVVRNSNEYYALGNDGQSHYVGNSIDVLEGLDSSYSWNYGLDDISCWWYNGSTYLNLANTNNRNVIGTQKDYVFMSAFSSGFDIYRYYDGSKHLSWDTSGFKVTNHQDVPIRVYMKDKPYYDFTVAVNNENYGSVSCAETITTGDKKNKTAIVATPAYDCYFVGWRLGEQILDIDEYGATISAGTLPFPNDNLTLTAVFGKNYTSPATQNINEWVDGLLGNPLVSDKTAHVVDYDNRIYEVDLSASSSRYTIDQDIRIEFITDISRSMYFPETLLNEQDFTVNGQINLGQWLLDNGDPNEVYYVLADINNTATMYAVYSSGNNYFTRWSIVDASYYLPYDNASMSGRIKTVCQISNGNTTINMTDRFDGNANRMFTGKIYNSTPKPPKDTADWDRLSYLTAAVNAVSRAIYRLDPGAEIGLVTFASAASGGTLYGADDEESFLNALHSIQPTGGTNQTSAFNLINNSNPPIFTTNSGKRQVALLITDGAPQGTTWGAIESAAETTEGKGVEIWTLGIALDRVGENKAKLMDLASDGGYSGNAEDADQLVTETQNILEKMLVKATVIGEVYDTIDPAFYPVDVNGNPIEAGFYYADTDGGNITKHNTAPSDTKKSYYQWVNDNGTWSVTYFNQDIKWPEDGGWSSSFYIKAKEDFMGGNQISTNSGFDNRVEANRVKHSGAPDGYYWLNEDHSSFRADFRMPYVNVDELTMNENATEWRVYLGTEVNPAEELKKLWDKILINQVVKDNGAEDEVITITSGSQMYYSDALLNDAPAPDGTSNETLPLSHFVNAGLIDTLLQQIDNENPTGRAELTYRYFPYGHDTIGTFNIVLTKTIDTEEETYYAPGNHETTEKGENKEVYTLTVTYSPVNDEASETYNQTTSGHTAGKVADGYNGTTGELIQSENTHKIHVYAKTIEVEKLYPTGESTTSTLTVPAKFGIYRQWKESDGEENKKSLAGYKLGANTLTDQDFYFLVEEQTTVNGFAKFTEGLSAADDPYYLAETEPPEGYQHDKVLKVITVTPGPDIKTDLDGATTTTMPYNWTQGVKLSVDGIEAVYVDESGDQIIPTTSGEERDYVLPADVGYFKTSVLNTPVGYLRIEKQVTYNHDAPTTDAQKSALAGTYTFKIYTDEDCEHAYKVDGEDLKIEITIAEDGTAVKSDIVELPLGNYWLKETESTNTALFPVSDNPMSITITGDNTKTVPLDKSFINNYDENKDPDKIAIDIEKTFTGIQKSSHIPEGFKIILTYDVGSETKTINLVKDELEVESDGAKVRWSESEGGLVWHWHITNIPSDAVNFKLHEEDYDVVDGYDWSGTTLDRTAITLPDKPSNDHALSVTPPTATMMEVTEDRVEPDNDKNYKVYETDVILISLTGQHGQHGTLVVSQKSLNTKQRDAITAKIPSLQGSWKTPGYFFSIEEHPEGFYYKGSNVTYTWDETKGCYIVHVEHKQSSMEEVFLVSYDSQDSVNNADLVNDYEEIPIVIDVEKIKKGDETVKLLGAVFELRKIKDAEPGNGGTFASEDGTETKTSDATDSNGKTSFTGLTHGYYELTEKTAPDGYVMTSESTTTYFKVEAGKVTWLIKGSGKPSTWSEREDSTGDMVTFENAKVAIEDNPETPDVDESKEATNDTFIVQNEPGAALPNTGGPGTNMLYLFGLMLTGLAGAGLVMKRRRRDGREAA